MLDPKAVIDEFLASHDLDYEQKDESTYLITLPGEAKQQTHCALIIGCLLYTSPSPRDRTRSRMPSSA